MKKINERIDKNEEYIFKWIIVDKLEDLIEIQHTYEDSRKQNIKDVKR